MEIITIVQNIKSEVEIVTSIKDTDRIILLLNKVIEECQKKSNPK